MAIGLTLGLSLAGNTVVSGGGGSSGNVTLSPVSTQQYTNITPIDLTSYTSTGDKLYCIDMPEGLEVMRDSHRVLGAPVNTQSETNISIYVDVASGDDFWIYIPLTITASADPVYNVSTVAALYALTEFGTSYTGSGCVVNLAAGVTIDPGTTYKNNGRFLGLTSPIIIQSADPNNRATWTGKEFTFVGPPSGDLNDVTGNISFVNIDFDVDQDGAARNPEDALPAQAVVGMSGSSASENIAFIGCHFESNVQAGTTKVIPLTSMSGIQPARPTDRMAIINCTFTNLINGVLGICDNFLMKGCTVYEVWADMLRASPNSAQLDASYVMAADNVLYDNNGDGYQRHGDLIQMGGGGGSGYSIEHFEARGNVFSNAVVSELPAVSPTFTSTSFVSTNTAMGTTDHVLYRVETDTAAGDVTMTLPDPSGLSDGWELCVQKWSADTTHTVTVARNGSETIDGTAADYDILGAWKAVIFTVASGNWTIQIMAPGSQGLLYQNDGGLDLLNHSVSWYCGGVSNQASGVSTEVLSQNTSFEHITLVTALPGDRDGDSIVDVADGQPKGAFPRIAMRNTDPTAEVHVENSVAPTIEADAGVTGSFTTTNNDASQDVNTPSTITDLFVGEGVLKSGRMEIIRGLRIKKGSALDGGGKGAVGIGVADGGYDWVNKRPRLPGAPTVVTAPVIQDDGSSYSISTAAAFSTALVESTQWLLDQNDGDGPKPITDETGATLLKSNIPSDGLISVRVSGASSLGPPIADSVNELTYSATATVPDQFVSSDWLVSDLQTNGDVRITVSTLPGNGGSSITDLEYQLDGGSWVSLSGATTGNYDVAGLTDETAYAVALRAVNAVGNGAASATKAVTPTGVPSAFVDANWSVATGSASKALDITIASLPSANGHTITDVEYDVDASGTWVSLGATSGTVSVQMALAATSYDIRLRAVNSVGSGSAGNTESATSGADLGVTYNDGLHILGLNTDDTRRTRTERSLYSQTWIGDGDDQSVDTGSSFTPNMAQATRDALNAAGQFVFVVDVTASGADSGIVLRTQATTENAFNWTFAFSLTGEDWVADPTLAGYDHADFIDVSSDYGQAAGAVWRIYVVLTKGVQTGSARMIYQHNSSLNSNYYRNFMVFQRSTFNASDATMKTEIGALGV